MSIYSKFLPKNRFRPNTDPAGFPEIQEAKEYVNSCFNKLVEEDPFIGRVFYDLFNEGFEGVIFGGWVRDRIIELKSGAIIKSKDIDFVYKGKKNLNINSIDTNLVKKNMFGGYSIDYPTMHIDLWELENTYLIRKNKLKNEFSSLLESSDYTINAIIYYPKQNNEKGYILESGCFNAINNKELEFLADEVAFPLIQSARAVIFSAKFGLDLSKTVSDFIKSTCADTNSISEVKKGIIDFCHPDYKDKALKIIDSIILYHN